MNLKYICDNSRHLICIPYSVENLHLMAKELKISKNWFHNKKGTEHYDIPKGRTEEIGGRCKVVTPTEVVRIIRSSNGTACWHHVRPLLNKKMTIADRDEVFEELGFQYHDEHSHGLGVWRPTDMYKDGYYIFAKTMGTFDFMCIIRSDESVEDAMDKFNEDAHHISFKIISTDQLRIILKAL